MNLFKTVRFSVVGFFITFYHFSLLLLYRIYCIATKKPLESLFYHEVACKWGQRVFNSTPGWSIQIEGKENIPTDKPFVIVANHESATDIFAVYFLGIQFRWLSKDTVFKVPMVGPCMRWAGYISITRGQRESHKKALSESAECLKKGIPMLFFPEGTRSKTGRPKEFKIGAFKLANECGVPVLPVILNGAGKLMEKGTFTPRKAHLKIKILPTTNIADDESVTDYTKRVEKLVVKEHSIMTS